MPKRLDYDCIIVGGGLVGASLARALAGAPIRVAVIESQASASRDLTASITDGRALALSLSSTRILQTLGCWEQIAPAPHPIVSVYATDHGHFGATRFGAGDVGLKALGYVSRAPSLLSAITASTQGQANCEWLRPASVRRVELGNDSVTVECELGEPSGGSSDRSTDQLADSSTLVLNAALVIGADGSESALRQCLNIDVSERDYGQTAIVTSVTLEHPHQDCAFECFTPSGPLALLPLADNRAGSVWSVATERAESALALNDDEFCATLSKYWGRRVGRLSEPSPRRSYPLRLLRSHKNYGPRYAIIGNAANTVHPNAAQGLNLGLRDAATIAETIADAARAGQDLGAEPLLASYGVRRQADHNRVVGMTDGLADLFYTEFPPFVLGRTLGMLAIDLIPLLKRRFIRAALGLEGEPPRLVRGLPA